MITDINFKTNASNLCSIKPHKLSKNGPFIDIHLNKLNTKTPIGETYYLRPYSYISNDELIIDLNSGGLFTHFNTNTVIDKNILNIKGIIKISPFLGYNCPYCCTDKQDVNVQIKLMNNTPFPDILGIHIHDGKKSAQGLIGFSQICYFLYCSKKWINTFYPQSNYDKIKPPLPFTNINPKNPNFLLSLQ